MIQRRAGAVAALALAAFFGCRPSVRGRCNETADCRQGSFCSLDGICLASSGTCAPACGDGFLCSGSTCAMLRPLLAIATPLTPISPALSLVTVQVKAAPAIALLTLSVDVEVAGKTVASGAIAAPQDGDNLVALTSFALNAAGAATARATLIYRAAGGPGQDQVSSPAVSAVFDSSPPSVSVFVADSGSMNGWYSRSGPDLDVRATVDDHGQTGAQAATLRFDTCPAAAPCSYTGTAISEAGGATVFRFTVPRTVQAAGSEAPLPMTVSATDVAGNAAQGKGVLQIDAAPPRIGAFTSVTVGVMGEDGAMWFPGGVPGSDVTISVPVTDQGSGVKTVTVHVVAADLAVPTPDPAGQAQADGTWWFVLPASAVKGREGQLHFSVTASDQLGNSVTGPVTSINVDALPPAITAPHVDYTSVTPALNLVCNFTEAAGSVECGRRPDANGNATHVLPDDTVTVTFTLQDCGSGIAPRAQPDALTSAGPKTFAVARKPGSSPTCANGNKTYPFAFTLPAAQLVLPSADSTGTVTVQLTARGIDNTGNPVSSPANTTGSGNGLALVSTWRWRKSLSAKATGGPALLPGAAGARQVVIGTDAANPIFFVNADGSLRATPPSNPALTALVAGDVAAGPGGVYAVSGTANGVLSMVLANGTPVTCPSRTGATFGAPPVVAPVAPAGASDLAIAVSTTRSSVAIPVFTSYSFDTASMTCAMKNQQTTTTPGDSTGATATNSNLFISGAQGFTSYDLTGMSQPPQPMSYTAAANALAPPALLGNGANQLFADSTKHVLRETVAQTSPLVCGTATAPCWNDTPPAFATLSAGNLLFTPVYDGSAAWVVDDAGNLHRWSLSGNLDPLAAVPLTAPASPPVLLGNGVDPSSALIVQGDGSVTLVSPSGTKLLLGKVPLPTAFAPVVDVRSAQGGAPGQGVAYVGTAGTMTLWAIETPLPPLAATSSNWPRPGHDSCNTRNLNTDAGKCP